MLTLEDDEAILYRERGIHPALRVFAVVLGLGVMIVIPAPFVIHADWGTPSFTLVVAAACILFPLLLGPVFVLIGLASATELRLDGGAGWATRTLRGPVVNGEERIPLSALSPPEVVMNRNAEDGPFPMLRLALPGPGCFGRARRLDMACFADRAEAEVWQARIARLLAGAARG